MDALLSPILDELRGSLAGELDGTLGEAPCVVAIAPGLTVPADRCNCKAGEGCGMAWVRLSDLFAAGERFPAQDGTTRASCSAVLAAVLEVGVYRCQPVGDRQGNPPTAAELTQAALVQADDAMAMHRAIQCCPSITKRPHLLGRYAPRDGGGCGGGIWTVTVQLVRR